MYAAAPAGSQPLLQYLHILNLLLKHQLLGDKRCPGIKLFYKIKQDLGGAAVRHMGHIKMLPSDQLAVPHKKHLYHRIIIILGKGDNILILTVAVRDFLFLRHLLHTVIQIPESDRFFKIQIFRSLLHLLLQIRKNGLEIAVQEIQRFIHLFPVFFPGYPSLAGRAALADMIIQAGPVHAAVPRQYPAACPQLIKLIDQFNRILTAAADVKGPK